jgi:hypothetical protein
LHSLIIAFANYQQGSSQRNLSNNRNDNLHGYKQYKKIAGINRGGNYLIFIKIGWLCRMVKVQVLLHNADGIFAIYYE